MSILINDMEFPTSCYKCPMRRRDGMDIVCPVTHERFSVADVNILKYRLDSCPLVPVPPHGDSIDRDALRDNNCDVFEINGADGTILAMDVSIIDDAPTIIPAEEGE